MVGGMLAAGALAFLADAWRGAPQGPPAGQTLRWADLVPPGWAPWPVQTQLALIRDDSPAGRLRWSELQKRWASAPLRQSLDGAQVRISGYAVPLDGGAGGLAELLLVPYFGACIHAPAPPANQIIWVALKAPVRGLGAFDVIEIAGRLRVSRQFSALATSGYAMKDAVLLSKKEAGPR